MKKPNSKFITYYCSCGATFKVTSHTPKEKELAEYLFAIWKAQHTGEGHAETTSNESNMVRNNWTTRYYRIGDG